MYEARFSTQSESGTNCRPVLGIQDSLRVARCDSIRSSEFSSRSDKKNRSGVSSPSIMRSVSKFYALVSLQSAIGLVNNRTFRGSESCSISEYPVASAIGSRVESDLTRCSVMVSVKEDERGPGNTDAKTQNSRDRAPQSFAYQNMSIRNISNMLGNNKCLQLRHERLDSVKEFACGHMRDLLQIQALFECGKQLVEFFRLDHRPWYDF